MLSTRRSLRAAAMLAAGLLAAGTAAQAEDKVHFRLDWIPTGEHAAYFAGMQKGFWKAQGIDIELSRGYGSGDTVAKMAGGAGIDFGLADIGAVLTARARTGTPVKTIAAIYTHSPHSLFVLESSGIKDFKGLEGKKISITPGNSHKLYFPNVAARAGTDPDKIIWVNTDASAMAALLISKRIDAAPFYSIHHYYQNKAAKAAGEEIVVLPFERTGFTIYAASLTATDEMLEKNPDLVRRFIKGTLDSWRWAYENQKEACELHVKKNPEVAQDDCEGSLKAASSFVFNEHSEKTGLGHFDPERLKFTWEVVAEAQELPKDWDYTQAVDTRFVP
jgi:NitT/TauT family transport system substrate-binding protein